MSPLFVLFLTVIATCAIRVRSVAPGRQINITVMVPGIEALRYLALDSEPLPGQPEPNGAEYAASYDSEPDYGDSYRDEDPAQEDNSSTGGDFQSKIDESQVEYDGEYLHNYCIDEDTGLPDIACLTRDYNVYPWSYVFAKPALEVALDTIHNTPGLLDDFRIQLRYFDSSNANGFASSRISQIASVDAMMHDHMTAMIGPMDAYSMSRVASFTSHWNLLNFTPGCISRGLRSPYKGDEAATTLVRTGPVETQVGNCVASILGYYNWSTTATEVFDDNLHERFHYFMAEGIYEQVIKTDPNYKMEQIRLSEYLQADGTYSYDTAMKALNNFARVLIISAEDFVVRDFLKSANLNKHESGEYAYVIVDLSNKLGSRPWESILPNGTLVSEHRIKEALQSALIITLKQPKSELYEEFVERFKTKLGSNMDDSIDANLTKRVVDKVTELESWRYGTLKPDEYFKKNQYPAFFHDSLVMLAHILNDSLSENVSASNTQAEKSTRPCGTASVDPIFPNGTHLMNHYVIGKTFEGVTGKIAINNVGDRLFDFAIMGFDPLTGVFKQIGAYDAGDGQYYEVDGETAQWPSGAVPRDVPKCGFNGKKCIKDRLTVIEAIVISVVSLATVAVIVSVNTYRRHTLQKELESQLWRVYWCDISWPNGIVAGQMEGDPGVFGDVPTDSDPSLGEVISYYVPSLSPAIAAKRAHKRKRKWSSNSKRNERVENERKTSAGSLISDKFWGGVTTSAVYKDKVVVVKLSNRRKVELNKTLLMELKHMRDITHDHLTRFEGACVEWPHICVLTEYCSKGSLRDILLNDEIHLDWMFRVSLTMDLVKGMSFLHGSAIHSHGNLKSTNCVVDSRFVLKITDYGLASFRNIPSYEEMEKHAEKKLWTAPELLRCSNRHAAGTQKADVYSFGVILQEIALRKGTFYVGGIPLSCKEILMKLRNGFRPYFRPLIDYSSLSEDVCSLMQRCWNEDPNERPDFGQIKKIVEKFNKDNPGNLVENLLHRMEQYAINLEGLVEERTAAYLEEKQKADDLLYQMLPVPVVDRLKRGDSVPAEAFESVTICFSDIVGFTSLSAASNPMDIVSLLNDLYTCFDAIIDNFDVYKVETIGDAYMMVSGLPVHNGIRHAAEIARTALALLKAVNNFKIRHRPADQLKLRIGIHTGPCCAGVVGLKMPRYCLFGDTVNTASRMESSGLPLAIHVSQPTKRLLDRFQCFKLQLRGEVPMKGKGMLTTYWLLEESFFDVQSLDESESRV